MDQGTGKDTRVHRRLYFIRCMYEGDSVETAVEKVGVYKMVAYQWEDRWNKDGYEGLVPRFADGKPAKLSSEKIESLRSILLEMDDWTTEEVQYLIEKRFEIRFPRKHVRKIPRKLGMKYAELYQNDYRRPKNEEDDPKKLGVISIGDRIIGFLDEYSPQTTFNIVRIWSSYKTKRSRTQRSTVPIHSVFTQSTETVS